jgi:hypothetical protein
MSSLQNVAIPLDYSAQFLVRQSSDKHADDDDRTVGMICILIDDEVITTNTKSDYLSLGGKLER